MKGCTGKVGGWFSLAVVDLLSNSRSWSALDCELFDLRLETWTAYARSAVRVNCSESIYLRNCQLFLEEVLVE